MPFLVLDWSLVLDWEFTALAVGTPREAWVSEEAGQDCRSRIAKSNRPLATFALVKSVQDRPT